MTHDSIVTEENKCKSLVVGLFCSHYWVTKPNPNMNIGLIRVRFARVYSNPQRVKTQNIHVIGTMQMAEDF